MKTPIKMMLIVSVLAALSGCVAVPVHSGYYELAPVVYVPAPAFYGPSIQFGIYGGRGGHGQGYSGRRGHGYR